MKIEISPQKNNIFLSMVEYGRRSMRHHKCGAVLTTKKRNILITPYMHIHTHNTQNVFLLKRCQGFLLLSNTCVHAV